ncbi:MAG: hypothetical protein K6E85_07105 [Lachnospiraceae bacterium]|nr:hypothetical protein [Lachnospiraceae bacterium]
MGDLTAYGGKVTSVFQLIGTLENDITKSVAWALCQCPVFAKKVFDGLFDIDCVPEKIRINYQVAEKEKGITDLEITDDEFFYAIIEAKRGWNLPCADQLSLYYDRSNFSNSTVQNKAIITMSECSVEYADEYLPFKEIQGIPIKHLPWRRLYDLAKESIPVSNNAQKRLLAELMEYFGGIMTTQQKSSNWVYVVSLSNDRAGDSNLTYIDIVEKKGKYYHPFGNKWPKEAPNYIAFRYHGQLQSIHHIESYVITKNVHDEISEMPDEEWNDAHFVYTLGPAIKPSKTVKAGEKVRMAARVWAMLDLLLTEDTVSKAMELSKQRMNS